MPKSMIKHLAIRAKDQELAVSFYKATFGMYEAARRPGNTRGIFLSDGYINLAVLPCAEDGVEGIAHLGFEVDSASETAAVATSAGARRGLQPKPQDGRFAEASVVDPTGTTVDVSEAGWRTEPWTDADAPSPGARHHKIRHVALLCKDQETTAAFYQQAFGMHVVAWRPGTLKGIFLSDGYINLAILPCFPGREEGINHFGFEVDDLSQTEAIALKSGARRGLDIRPQDGRYAEGGIIDPSGCGIDLSVAGWRTTPAEPAPAGAAG